MDIEQAIEIIDKMIKSYIEADECGLSNNDFKHEIEAMRTVLNMLKEKDKEIEKLKKENEHWKNGFERELEDNRKNTCELLKQDLIIRKKDKQIDLMAEFIYAMWCVYPGSFTKALRDRGFDDKECGTCESKEKNCLDCIKQYFKSKAEKECI